MDQFHEEANICLNEGQVKCNCIENNKTNCLTKFCRKKYKCCLLWLLTIISMTQLLYIILDKVDTRLFEALLVRFISLSSKNSTNITAPMFLSE